MALTKDQKAWAQGHVGQTTTVLIDGEVSSYTEADGVVTFTVTAPDGTEGTFAARPPLSAAEQAALDSQREAEAAAAAEAATAQAEQDQITAEETARQAAEQAAEEQRNLIRETLREELPTIIKDVLADTPAPAPARK